MIVTVATRGRVRRTPLGQRCQGRTAAMPVSFRRQGPPEWSVIRVAGRGASGALSTPLLRNQEFTLHPLEALHRESPSSSRLSASIADAFGDGLIRSAPGFAPPRRHDARQATTIQFEMESIRSRAPQARHNRPGHEELRLVDFGEHEASVGNADIGPLFRIARCAAWPAGGV